MSGRTTHRFRIAIAVGAALLGSLVGGLAPSSADDSSNPPASQAVAIGRGGAVASVDRTATRAGIGILERGGNAVDAAVATAAALGVTEPYVAGIGGGGFMVVYLAREHRIVTIDGREKAPQTFPTDAFIDPATGKPIPFYPERVTSGLSVGVPGTLMTWQVAASRYGTMPLSKLLRPSISIADRGFLVDQNLYDQTAQNLPRFRAFTSTRALYLTPDLQVPAVGTRLRNPDLAHTYRLIASQGIGALYEGSIGQAVAQTVQHPPLASDANLGFAVRPGLMTLSDLEAYTAPERAPTRVDYRGLSVYSMAPPSSGGSTVGEALNILEGFNLSGPDRTLALHRYLEASRLSFADRNRWIGDPDHVSVPLSGLLSKDFAASRRCLIGPTALVSPVPPGNPFPPFACPLSPAASGAGDTQPGSTNHLTVADRWGNLVSYTNTIEQLGGSAIAVPGYGFLLNNELTDFDPAPLFANQPDLNLPAGGKRPRSSMSPTIVMKGSKPLLGIGSPGGSTIITTVLQILIDRFDFGMSLPDAIAAPRASQRNAATTDAEPAFIAQHGNELQSRFGQRFNPVDSIGSAAGIEFLANGLVQAAAEPVRGGGGDAEVVSQQSDDGSRDD
jgi:gamma-glutamyltranspeptidase / glutathione hydrolase